ncbi:MAG: hypothetical protein H7Y27_14215 [Gemmatimonadaceae bacterium]|nr:hypothetical protein [Chitinophagaceae bacterium]
MKIKLSAVLCIVLSSFASSAQNGSFHNDGIELTNDESRVWTTRFTNNVLRDSGLMRKSVPDGQWKVWDQDGNLKHIRTFSSEKLRRIKNEMRVSHPRRINHPLTNIYMKNRAEALRYLHPSYAFPAQEAYKPVFREGLLNGLYMNFFEDGSSRDSGVYSNGLREGVWVEKDRTGTVSRGIYKNGKKSGAWNEYRNGQILRTVFYSSRGHRKHTKTYGSTGR